MRCFIFWISFRTKLWKVVQNWIARDLLFWQISQISLAFSFFSFCTAHQLQKAKARLITRCSLWRKNGNHLGLPLLEFSTFLNTCSRVGQIKGVPKPLLKGGKRELLCSRSSEKKRKLCLTWKRSRRLRSFAFVESNVGFVEFNSTSFSFFIVALSTKVE